MRVELAAQEAKYKQAMETNKMRKTHMEASTDSLCVCKLSLRHLREVQLLREARHIWVGGDIYSIAASM